MDQYVNSRPSTQNALNTFQGEWLSTLPNLDAENLTTGENPLFNDSRILWAIEQNLGVTDSYILELGPLEGGHSYTLEKCGAKKIVGIEANTRAFQKCLIVKNIYNLNNTNYLCGDFYEYLKYINATKERFDLCIACGVLYHTISPIEILHLIANSCDSVYIWTHYYDSRKIMNNPKIAHRFHAGQEIIYNNFKHTIYRHEYKSDLGFQFFAGGPRPFSHWISRDDLLACLKLVGFNSIQIQFDDTDSPAGPNISLFAKREFL